jgi:hypothetical protein
MTPRAERMKIREQKKKKRESHEQEIETLKKRVAYLQQENERLKQDAHRTKVSNNDLVDDNWDTNVPGIWRFSVWVSHEKAPISSGTGPSGA